MLVCWTGGPSPIHNHAGSDCLMAVVRGIVREIKYHPPKNEYEVEELHVKEVMELQEGEVHLINDQIGLHKMETLDENSQAVTLHCYIPPYSDCFTFDTENRKIKTNIAHTTYDTEFGETI
jgi:cysteine dioxygenase